MCACVQAHVSNTHFLRPLEDAIAVYAQAQTYGRQIGKLISCVWRVIMFLQHFRNVPESFFEKRDLIPRQF